MHESADADIGMRDAWYAPIAGIGVGMAIILSLTALACVFMKGV
jgi:hypothetical protein